MRNKKRCFLISRKKRRKKKNGDKEKKSNKNNSKLIQELGNKIHRKRSNHNKTLPLIYSAWMTHLLKTIISSSSKRVSLLRSIIKACQTICLMRVSRMNLLNKIYLVSHLVWAKDLNSHSKLCLPMLHHSPKLIFLISMMFKQMSLF